MKRLEKLKRNTFEADYRTRLFTWKFHSLPYVVGRVEEFGSLDTLNVSPLTNTMLTSAMPIQVHVKESQAGWMIKCIFLRILNGKKNNRVLI